jgi:FkbM family methyltransferase
MILQGIRSYYGLFGARGLVFATKARLQKVPLEVRVSVPGFPHPFHLRLRTTDVSLLSEIILHLEYDWHFSEPPLTIVDAGANIGLSSVFFAARYPDATVIAIEPEAANYELLTRNAAPYPNIIPVCAALWKADTRLAVVNTGAGEWGFQIRPLGSRDTHDCGQVSAVTLDALMQTYKLERIDVLKIDIEGAEKEVFERSCSWIGKVDVILIELHDRFRPGCSEAFERSTSDFSHRWQRGEVTLVARNRCALLEDVHGTETLLHSLPWQVKSAQDC